MPVDSGSPAVGACISSPAGAGTAWLGGARAGRLHVHNEMKKSAPGSGRPGAPACGFQQFQPSVMDPPNVVNCKHAPR